MRRMRFVTGATVTWLMAVSGCSLSITDPNEAWPAVEQVQLSIGGTTIKVRRAGGLSGPVPVLRLGENPVMATAFRQYYGGREQLVQAPRFALELLPLQSSPFRYDADSADTFSGVLVATETTNQGLVRVQLLEPATGRIHFGPVVIPIIVIDY